MPENVRKMRTRITTNTDSFDVVQGNVVLFVLIDNCIFLLVNVYALFFQCNCQYTKKGSNNNDILDGLSVVDKYVQIAINKLHLLKYVNT